VGQISLGDLGQNYSGGNNVTLTAHPTTHVATMQASRARLTRKLRFRCRQHRKARFPLLRQTGTGADQAVVIGAADPPWPQVAALLGSL
jgi:hypothetical protein